MIEINLLPTPGKKKAARSSSGADAASVLAALSSRMRDRFLLGTLAITIVAGAAVATLYTLQEQRDDQLNAQLDRMVHDSTRYAALVRDRIRAEAIRDTLLRQVNMIRNLDEDRYIWPHVMDEVGRALPQYTWVTALTFIGTPQGATNVVALPKPSAADSAKNGKTRVSKRLDTDVPRDQVTLQVNGRTVDIQALTRFMKDLEASPFLGSVSLLRSELAIDVGKEVTQFQLTAGYTRPDTTLIRRVAFSLTGGR